MLHSSIYAGHTLITAFRKLKCLSSLNIRNYYYYSVLDYSTGFGGRYGVQKDRQDKVNFVFKTI